MLSVRPVPSRYLAGFFRYAALSLLAVFVTSQGLCTSARAASVIVAVSPVSSSVASGGKVSLTATVTGSTNTGVKWSATSVSGDSGTITGRGNTIQYSNASPGVARVTATSEASPTQSTTVDVLFLPAGQSYPTVPYPISTHPRLWVTPADVSRLQGWATASNPVYEQGMTSLLKEVLQVYNTRFFPGGKANPNWPDAGDVQGYQAPLAEENALILAFNSLIDPSPAKRITYAQYARNLIMVPLKLAEQGHLADAPYRDPAFAVYNRASATGKDWPLVVDWIYDAKDAKGQNILTAADKAIVRNVFLLWAADCVTASTTGGDSPLPTRGPRYRWSFTIQAPDGLWPTRTGVRRTPCSRTTPAGSPSTIRMGMRASLNSTARASG